MEPSRWLVPVVASALVAGVAGFFLFGLMLAESQTAGVAPGEPAKLSGLSLQLELVQWTGHDLHRDMDRGNFPMPASMMPGAPAKDEDRLHLEVSLQNQARASRHIAPDEFRLRSATGRAWSFTANSFRPAVLLPSQLMYLDLYFDVPKDLAPLYLAWTRDGRELQISVSDNVPAHGHEGG